MNPDNPLDQDLARLGRSMRSDDDFVNCVMRQIDTVERRPAAKNNHRWWMPVGLSLAASLLVAFACIALSHHWKRVPVGRTDMARLVRSSTEMQAVSVRPITLEGEVPARELSRQKFERVTWTDPQRHATFERMVPREKVTLITLDTY